jgi:hypothetical protein
MNTRKQLKILLNKLNYQTAQLHTLLEDIVMILWESFNLP